VNCYGEQSPEWVKEYTTKYLFVDKKQHNVGSNIYTYLNWIVENYNKLPKLVVFTKNNMLQRHITKEEFEKVRNNTTLTPLMTMNHKTYEPVSLYQDGLYWEINNYWYVNEHPHRRMEELIDKLGVRDKDYLKFSPGGCWIATRENIYKQTRQFYKDLMGFVDYDSNPAESHLLERSLYHIWS
jgi:hypothetical protein